MVAGIISLVSFGLKFGIDFKGGTITEVEYKNSPDIQKIREAVVGAGISSSQLQTTGEHGVLIKTGVLDSKTHEKLQSALKEQTGEFTEKRFESIGPLVGQELRKEAIWQLVLVSLGIVLYIAYAFRRIQKPITSWKFG